MTATRTISHDYRGTERPTVLTYYHLKDGRRLVEAVPEGSNNGRAYDLPPEITTPDAALDYTAQIILEGVLKETQRLEEMDRAMREKGARLAAELERLHTSPGPIVIGYRCPQCQHTHDEEPEVDPRYECPSCGSEFSRSESDYDSHRSSCCGKFSSKVTDTTCPECQEGVDEFEQVECYARDDGTLIPVEDV